MQTTENFILTIFGASGDLAKKKLVPALYNLYVHHLIGGSFAILGIGRTAYTDETFRQYIASATGIQDQNFLRLLHYLSINTSDTAEYIHLQQRIAQIDKQFNCHGNVLFYMSTPPSLFPMIVSGIMRFGLNQELSSDMGWRRIIIEKPFGYDLSSARQLNNNLLSVFGEHQIYRIDHYLGKETVQNILVTRFSNSIFEPLWNHRYIDHVQISAVEDMSTEGRGGYYDSSGALRDMVQNHLLQVFGMIAMEEPVSLDAQSIRDSIISAFNSLRILSPEQMMTHIIRGQYTASGNGEFYVPGYKDEEGINPLSHTETYVALKTYIENDRWRGVPFFFRTGKRLRNKVSEVVIQFKPAANKLFASGHNEPNQLVFRIQPDEGILWRFGLKKPGTGFDLTDVNMLFRYSSLSEKPVVSGYDRLVLDCLNGDSTLFSRGDAQEASWKFITPILEFFNAYPNHNFYEYKAGTWGPWAATELIFKSTGYLWRNTCRGLENECVCML